MIRNLVIVLLTVALLACLYSGVYQWRTAETKVAMRSDHPELEWLRREYQLDDAQFRAIRAKHEAHDIVCRQLCLDLIAARKKLDAAIAASPEMNEEVETAFTEWSSQRKICREATIAHMYEVSSLMSPEAGARYRERVLQHLIVPGRMPHIGEDGEFHEELIEHAAPAPMRETPEENDGSR
jgi:hypothetical protein